MVTTDMKDEWRSATTISGALFVRTFLEDQTVQWSAGNWDWAMQVWARNWCINHCRCSLNTFLIAGASTPTQAHFGDGSGKPVWLDNVACLGTENNLIDCRANPLGSGNCGHDKDVGTRCLPIFSKSVFEENVMCA